MNIYQSRYPRLTGSSYIELERKARQLHKDIAGRTKRNPYIRSAYFKNEKVFIKLFWEHLNQKPRHDRKRRLRYFQCGLDLLRNTTFIPEVESSIGKSSEIFYRFVGKTLEGDVFYVQIKQDRKKNKYFMSVFPEK